MKRNPLAIMMLVLCIRASLMPVTALAADDAFVDVSETAWYAEAVEWAVDSAITSGIGNGQFGPDNPCTRAQAVTFLWNAAGKPAPKSGENPFTDVAENQWYTEAVLWAVEEGVTNGISATEFGLDQLCTREQFVTFLYRAEGKPKVSGNVNPFDDVADGQWYTTPIRWAVSEGITNGVSATQFGVGNICNRAQVVTFLYNDMVEAAIVHNYAELKAAVAGDATLIRLAADFTTEGEETAQVNIERALILDGKSASIDFGFEVLTGGVTIKNFNITTSEWGKAVCKNGKPNAEGQMTRGDCIAIEIHNTTDKPVVVKNCSIVHDVFLNNNSSIYLADGTYAHILNNNIKTENKSNASYERGGIYIGSGTRGKIVGNTIDSAKTAMPMSPLGLTANLDKMTAAVEMPSIEIKDNVCESIYVTKMYTNGVLFGDNGLIKEDDTDFGAREALEGFMAKLAANNSFAVKEGQLPADENVYVVSRLDLIYAGTPLKQDPTILKS